MLLLKESLAPYILGSFELCAEQVRVALQAQVSLLFGSHHRATVLATHQDAVVVVVEDLGAYRIPYAIHETVGVAFGDPETVPVRALRPQNIGAFVEEQSQGITEALRRRDVDEAKRRALALLPFVRPGLREAFQEELVPPWRHLHAKIFPQKPLPLGEAVYGADVPEEDKFGALVLEARRKAAELRDILRELRDRYNNLRGSVLHEGAAPLSTGLSGQEMEVLYTSLHDDVFQLFAQGNAALRSPEREALANYVDAVSTLAPAFQTVVEEFKTP